MPRWRQQVDPVTGKSKFIPIGNGHRHVAAPTVHGDIQSFVSPIDGTVISDRKQLREHNKRHGVVNSAEFSPEFYQRKAEERARFYEGRHSKEESWRRKAEINEIINRAERS